MHGDACQLGAVLCACESAGKDSPNGEVAASAHKSAPQQRRFEGLRFSPDPTSRACRRRGWRRRPCCWPRCTPRHRTALQNHTTQGGTMSCSSTRHFDWEWDLTSCIDVFPLGDVLPVGAVVHQMQPGHTHGHAEKRRTKSGERPRRVGSRRASTVRCLLRRHCSLTSPAGARC